jgi:nucleoid DNA-binding protein
MQELIQQLVDKAGLTPQQAEKSIEVIKEYIQGQLPPMMQGMVDNFMGQQQNGNDRIGE